jgi:hypothetical protein
MSACVMDFGVALTSYPRSRAVGDEANEIQRQEIDIEREMLRPFGRAQLRAAIASVLSAAVERNSPDWDGYGARPASMASAQYAVQVLKEALLYAAAPEVSVDPDGEVALTWHHGPRRVFSVSVGPRGALTYAGIFGESKLHGVEAHVANGLPREIRASIQRVYTNR